MANQLRRILSPRIPLSVRADIHQQHGVLPGEDYRIPHRCNLRIGQYIAWDLAKANESSSQGGWRGSFKVQAKNFRHYSIESGHHRDVGMSFAVPTRSFPNSRLYLCWNVGLSPTAVCICLQSLIGSQCSTPSRSRRVCANT
jgi:hypothetical protein